MCVCRMEICFLLCSVSQCFICHSSSWTYTGTTQRASGCSPGISIILLIRGINMFYLQINLKKKDSSSFWIIYTTDKKQFYVLKIVGGVLIVSLAEIKNLQWLQNHRLSRSPCFTQTGVKKKKGRERIYNLAHPQLKTCQCNWIWGHCILHVRWKHPLF